MTGAAANGRVDICIGGVTVGVRSSDAGFRRLLEHRGRRADNDEQRHRDLLGDGHQAGGH